MLHVVVLNSYWFIDILVKLVKIRVVSRFKILLCF